MRSVINSGADMTLGLGTSFYEENTSLDSTIITRESTIGVNPFHRSQDSMTSFLGTKLQTPASAVLLHFATTLSGLLRMRNHHPLSSSWPRDNDYDFHRWYVNALYSKQNGTERDFIVKAQKTGRRMKIRLDQTDCSVFLRPTLVFFRKEKVPSPLEERWQELNWPNGELCAISQPVILNGDLSFNIKEETRHFLLAEIILTSANTASALVLCEWRDADIICHSRPTKRDRINYRLRDLQPVRHILSGAFLNRKKECKLSGEISWYLEST